MKGREEGCTDFLVKIRKSFDLFDILIALLSVKSHHRPVKLPLSLALPFTNMTTKKIKFLLHK